jgi:ribosome-associated toxin RatA of RatAB toxin-antitoxin module
MAGAERKETVDVPLKDFFAVVSDYAAYPDFVTGMKSVRILANAPGSKQVEFDLEMMKRVQYTLDIRETLDAESGTGSILWTLHASDMFKANNGGWTLRAVSPTRTEVSYKLDLEFNIPVPGFVLKGLVANALPTAIKEFAERAKKRPSA